jgi:hypothetical protein
MELEDYDEVVEWTRKQAGLKWKKFQVLRLDAEHFRFCVNFMRKYRLLENKAVVEGETIKQEEPEPYGITALYAALNPEERQKLPLLIDLLKLKPQRVFGQVVAMLGLLQRNDFMILVNILQTKHLDEWQLIATLILETLRYKYDSEKLENRQSIDGETQMLTEKFIQASGRETPISI